MDSLKVAALQLNSSHDSIQNVNHITQLLNSLPVVDLVTLPENALYFQMRSKEKELKNFSLTDDIYYPLQRWVDNRDSALLIGGVPILEEGHRYNACLWLEKSKTPKVVYKKIHLFDVEVEGKSFKESDSFTHGEDPMVVDFRGWNLGMSICYDLRFSALYEVYANQSVDMILVPSSFLEFTGRAHWHVLNRARAIECQCYVVSSAQSGLHNEGGEERQTYGHTLIVDPWGEVLEEVKSSGSGFVVHSCEKSKIKQVRARIPMKDHRRI